MRSCSIQKSVGSLRAFMLHLVKYCKIESKKNKVKILSVISVKLIRDFPHLEYIHIYVHILQYICLYCNRLQSLKLRFFF